MARKSKKLSPAIEAEYSQPPVVTEAEMISAEIIPGEIPENVGKIFPTEAERFIERLEADENISVTTEIDLETPELPPDPNEPTVAEIEAALAEIVPEMETAVVAGAVDHESQLASWTPSAIAAEELAERELDEAIAMEEGVEPEVDLDQKRATVAELEAQKMVWQIRNGLDDREAFEVAQSEREALEKGKEPNANIFRTLKKVRTQMVTMRAAKLLVAIDVEPAFINRTVNEGSRYNVYALGKLSDVIYGVTDGALQNAINLACLRSLFAMKRAGLGFDMETAKGACSRQYALKKLSAAVRSHLISHTVSESTAPTQASSTMQALTTLGVVRCNGAGKNASYELTDAPITRKLEAMLKAA